MLVVDVDSAGVLKQLGELADNVGSLDEKVPEEFLAWQRDDMNRQFPKVEEAAGSWFTLIFPRSRLSQERTKTERRRRPLAAPSVIRKGQVVAGSSRPVLRPELFDQLCERMRALLATVVGKK